jgi:hypothetical protein
MKLKKKARNSDAAPLEKSITIKPGWRATMSKRSKICEAWAAGDRIGALRIAAQFFDRSKDTQIFKRGMDAHNHPDFYRQRRQDPDQITTAALLLLARKFNLTS